jgi:hypothetical protein
MRAEAERDEQHVQHEELGRALARDEMNHARIGRWPRNRMTASATAALSAANESDVAISRPDCDSDGMTIRNATTGEILEQQDGHHVAAVRRAELHALGQHLRHDRRGAHRKRAAEHHADMPAIAQEVQDDHRADRRDHHLGKAEPEHGAPHRPQLRQAELEPDGEHEEHHAELAHRARGVVERDERERVVAEDDAHAEIAEDRRQMREPAHDDHDDGGSESVRTSRRACGIVCRSYDTTAGRDRQGNGARDGQRVYFSDEPQGFRRGRAHGRRERASTRRGRSRERATCSPSKRRRSSTSRHGSATHSCARWS